VGAVGFLSDLWKFSPSTGGWTWVAGSATVATSGVYGSQGVAAATNAPGARRDATGWTDANGSLFLFGGWGADSAGTVGNLNDLWEYLPASGQWVWLSGTNTANALAVHGTIGVTAPTNMPGAREQVTSVKDANGTVWLFGGFGYAPTNTPNEINELWTIPTQ
jgi:N-acetylneuraminic acid mutarotase